MYPTGDATFGTTFPRKKPSPGRRPLWTSIGSVSRLFVFLAHAQGLPSLPRASNASEAAKNGVEFYRHLQSSDGHFPGEYGGPMFLLPGLIIGMYATKTPIPEPWRVEIARYLWNRRNPVDGGWGMYVDD